MIGPAVVNVRGGLEYVQDRCEYTLLSVSSDQNLTVTGRFQERRRKDVSFLDRVTLNLSSPVHLEQGGRVLVSNLKPLSCDIACQPSPLFSVTSDVLIPIDRVVVAMTTDVPARLNQHFSPLCVPSVMQLEDVTLNINSTAQQVLDGVRVSKDHTGVTARVNLSNTLEAVVYFDGYTALIGLKGTDTIITTWNTMNY